MTPILTVTLNPALDVSTAVEKLEARRKLRCAEPRYDPGGGGVNVSRTVRELGGESRAFVALAGFMGRRMRRLLEEAGLDLEVFELAGETRLSFKVMERAANRQYRFVLPGPRQEKAIADELLAAIGAGAGALQAGYVVASGSLTPGLPDRFYADLAARVREGGARLILDTSGAPLAAALEARPYLIKADRQEAEGLLRQGAFDAGSPETMAEALFERGAAEVVIVTLGAEGALVASDGLRRHIRPPKVEVRSTVGAGDSFVGALCYGLANDWPLAESCRYGVAAAAAAVTTEATELARGADIEDVYGRMRADG